jgi:hypothetical protein
MIKKALNQNSSGKAISAFVEKRYIKRNKYNAKQTSYAGRVYHSALECTHAIELDWMKKAGEIKAWEPQHKIDLSVNGTHICNYYIDFKVIMNDFSEEYHEVKGLETDIWRIKWLLTKALYPDYKLILIK